MIKKLFFTALLLIFSSNLTSQNNPEQQAGEITKEMVNVLSLDDVQTEKVYKIQLSRFNEVNFCLLYTSPSPRDGLLSRMPSSA